MRLFSVSTRLCHAKNITAIDIVASMSVMDVPRVATLNVAYGTSARGGGQKLDFQLIVRNF